MDDDLNFNDMPEIRELTNLCDEEMMKKRLSNITEGMDANSPHKNADAKLSFSDPNSFPVQCYNSNFSNENTPEIQNELNIINDTLNGINSMIDASNDNFSYPTKENNSNANAHTTRKNIIEKHDKIQTLKNLKQKEDSLYSELNDLKRKKDLLSGSSFNNLNADVERNIKNSQLKSIKMNEQLIMAKLDNLKEQVNDLLEKERIHTRKLNIQEYLDKYRNEKHYVKKDLRIQHLQRESNLLREKRLSDLEHSIEKRNKELSRIEEDNKHQRFLNLIEKREMEREIVKRRKKEIDLQMLRTKIDIRQQKNFLPHTNLYSKMKDAYDKREQKLVEISNTLRKTRLTKPENSENALRRMIDSKIKLEQRSIDKTKSLRNIWHSRSLIAPKYKSPYYKRCEEEKKAHQDKESRAKLDRIVLTREKRKYGNESVPMPNISAKLREEVEKRSVNISELHGKDRVRYVNEEMLKKQFRNKISCADCNYKKSNRLIELNSVNSSNVNNSLANNVGHNNVSQQNISNNLVLNNVNNLNNSNNKRRKKKYFSNPSGENSPRAHSVMKRNPKEINYLIELREKNIFQPKPKDWRKMLDKEEGKGETIEHVKSQVECLEERVKRDKEFMRLNGGYINNQDIGDGISELLIDSIKAKLAIVNALKS